VTTRRRLSPEVRRAQLEDATLQVVAAQGYAATNADAIAATAGVSKGLLWHHYDDIDALMAAAARRALGELETAVATSIDIHAPVADVLHAAIRRAAQLPRTHARQLAAISQIVNGLRRADGSPVLNQDEYAELYSAQERLLRRGQAEGSIRPDLDARLLAVTYQSAVDSMVDHLLQNPGVDPDAFADLTATVLLHGVAPPARCPR
jgi:AcrR family transcriptional regulator